MPVFYNNNDNDDDGDDDDDNNNNRLTMVRGKPPDAGAWLTSRSNN